jgi:hypothetical protein
LKPSTVPRLGAAALGVAFVLATGCAHPHPDESGESRLLVLEHAPSWLAGPSAAVLAGNGDFTARVVWHRRDPADEARPPLPGLLAARDGSLFFAPGGERKHGPRPFADGVFVANPTTGEGFVTSEALQGYAPLTNRVGAARINAEPVAGAAHASRHGHDGEPVVFRVATGTIDTAYPGTRATDLGGFPLELNSAAGGPPWMLELEDIRKESPPAEWFRPPEGYTRYESAPAMVGDLLVRGAGQHGGRPGEGGFRPAGRRRRGY